MEECLHSHPFYSPGLGGMIMHLEKLICVAQSLIFCSDRIQHTELYTARCRLRKTQFHGVSGNVKELWFRHLYCLLLVWRSITFLASGNSPTIISDHVINHNSAFPLPWVSCFPAWMLNPRQLLVLPQQIFVNSMLPSNLWFCRHCEIEEWAFVSVAADSTATFCTLCT